MESVIQARFRHEITACSADVCTTNDRLSKNQEERVSVWNFMNQSGYIFIKLIVTYCQAISDYDLNGDVAPVTLLLVFLGAYFCQTCWLSFHSFHLLVPDKVKLLLPQVSVYDKMSCTIEAIDFPFHCLKIYGTVVLLYQTRADNSQMKLLKSKYRRIISATGIR